MSFIMTSFWFYRGYVSGEACLPSSGSERSWFLSPYEACWLKNHGSNNRIALCRANADRWCETSKTRRSLVSEQCLDLFQMLRLWSFSQDDKLITTCSLRFLLKVFFNLHAMVFSIYQTLLKHFFILLMISCCINRLCHIVFWFFLQI